MSRQWTDLQRYVIEEHFEDYTEGRISRRELLKRVSYITGGAAASLVALTALGCNVDQPRALGSGTAAPTAPAASATVKPASPQPNVAYATPPTTATTNPMTVKPDDPRLRQANAVTIPSAGGTATLIGYEAYPALPTGHGVLVMHENIGLTDHIRDVVRRVATAGYMGFGIDLLSRQGGADKLGGGYSGALANTTVEQMNADLITAIAYVHAKGGDGYAPVKVGAVGFCFGGGTTWNLVNAGAPLAAAVPFYGPLPSDPAGLATTKSAVLAIYAEQDTRITASWPDAEAQLKKSGTPYAQRVEPGVGHAFHNDTNGATRYGPAQAQDAWVATIEWFRKYLGS
ncbi:MAG TPA: dienelactone hydrolase family protein [Candidatus Limnocylindria bacterium]|nr:dienelactone hydrolase family protein [Candidatus Limnocylindria bacterium]